MASGSGCPVGEFWLVHKSGSQIKFHNDGSVEVNANTDLKVTATGTVSIYATAIRLGAAAGDTLKKLITDAFVTLFNTHTHSGCGGASNSGVPNQTITSAHQTSIVQGE